MKSGIPYKDAQALCGAPTERGDGACLNLALGCPHHQPEQGPVDVRALLAQWDAQANRGAGEPRPRPEDEETT